MSEGSTDPDLAAFQRPPGSRGEPDRSPADPVSWLQIDQGWTVLSVDGTEIGAVAQVAGSKDDDIFDGLAVEVSAVSRVVYVPGEQVSAIYPGRVTLKLTAERVASLDPYAEAPPQTVLRPGPESLGSRLQRWLRR